MAKELPIEIARELFAYDPETGSLTRRKKAWRSKYSEGEAGHINTGGYRQVWVCGLLVLAHRLIWAHVHGRWPAGDIDHINGDRSDNRLANLREVTNQQNIWNRPRKGVRKVGRRWRAEVKHNGQRHYLGYFDTKEEAKAAYRAKLRELRPDFVPDHTPIPRSA